MIGLLDHVRSMIGVIKELRGPMEETFLKNILIVRKFSNA